MCPTQGETPRNDSDPSAPGADPPAAGFPVHPGGRSRVARLLSVLGWSPGVRALLGGTLLPCGCVAGVYDHWNGRRVTVIDYHGRRCPEALHRPGTIVHEG